MVADSWSFSLVAVCVLFTVNVEADPPPIPDDSRVVFPNGLFCEDICSDVTVLNGKSLHCFLSHGNRYHRFVARKFGFGTDGWEFYYLPRNVTVRDICSLIVKGDVSVKHSLVTNCSAPVLRKVQGDMWKFFRDKRAARAEVAAAVPNPLATDVTKADLLEGKDNQLFDLFKNLNQALSGLSKLPMEQIKEYLVNVIQSGTQNENLSKFLQYTDVASNVFKRLTNGTEKAVKEMKRSFTENSEMFDKLKNLASYVAVPPAFVCELAYGNICTRQGIIKCDFALHCCFQNVTAACSNPLSPELFNSCNELLDKVLSQESI